MKNATSNGTKHSHSCTMAFGRYSVAGTCSRCDELRAGAPARPDFVRHRRPSAAERDARFARELREHRAACHCGPVCTFGDW
jgi:hypothetical protein